MLVFFFWGVFFGSIVYLKTYDSSRLQFRNAQIFYWSKNVWRYDKLEQKGRDFQRFMHPKGAETVFSNGKRTENRWFRDVMAASPKGTNGTLNFYLFHCHHAKGVNQSAANRRAELYHGVSHHEHENAT